MSGLKGQCRDIFPRLWFFSIRQLRLATVGVPVKEFKFFSNNRGGYRIRCQLFGGFFQCSGTVRVPYVGVGMWISMCMSVGQSGFGPVRV